MERCKDYFCFVVWFVGIGYALLWPLSAIGKSGRPFGAFLVCGGSDGGALAALCDLPHPLTLPLGLHVLGFVAAMLVAGRLTCRLLRRWRTRRGISPNLALDAGLPHISAARLSSPPSRKLRTVKPRKEFGLRGAPR